MSETKTEAAKMDMSDADLQKLANMVGNMNNNVTVLKVGNDQTSDKEQVERYRRSNQQLRVKIERNISEIVKLEAEIRELQADAYVNTDDAKDKIIKELRKHKRGLKDQLDRAIEAQNTSNDGITAFRTENSMLKTAQETQRLKIIELENANEDSKKEIEELRAELDVRIKADNRFNNMDL